MHAGQGLCRLAITAYKVDNCTGRSEAQYQNVQNSFGLRFQQGDKVVAGRKTCMHMMCGHK